MRASTRSALLLAACLPASARAQGPAGEQIEFTARGTIVTPASSVERPEHLGRTAHTNVHIFHPLAGEAAAYGAFETPSSLACIYGLVKAVPGCNPRVLTQTAKGGSRLIAIVDAYDDPDAALDLATYSTHFGLPAAHFSVVYAGGVRPPQDPTGGWELEEALDTEVAHALAPGAALVLVEASSSTYADLLAAEQTAASLVEAAGGGEVSNSWSGAEFPAERAMEPYFRGSKVVFFASSGDEPGVGVPAALPNVVGVGGTTVNRDAQGNYVGQTSWANSGGGLSAYLPMPGYQQSVAQVVGAHRGAPDLELVANPLSGAWVYDSVAYGAHPPFWLVVGGTSLASPALAAIANTAAAFRDSGLAELRLIYANRGKAATFTDITAGACTNAATGVAAVGYDLCTGIGTPFGHYGK